VPETWISRDPEGDEEPVDPRQDYPVFAELVEQLAFLRSLPQAPLGRLLAAAPEVGSFAQVLQHLVLALALDQEELVPDPTAVSRFQDCFASGQMLPQVKQKVLGMLEAHLGKSLADPAGRTRIRAEIEGEIALLEEMSTEGLEDLFAVTEEPDEL
jgi:hypothetical protein